MPPQYSIEAYRLKLRMTASRVILVEGKTDKVVMSHLVLRARDKDLPGNATGLVIDTAEMLRSPLGSSLGNREKVELVASTIGDDPVFDHFVAFVDREFREFDDKALRDCLLGHYVQGHLVWTRGHSVENYFFEATLLRTAIQSLAVSDNFVDAADEFAKVWPQALRVACAVSFALRDCGIIGVGPRSLRSHVISVNDGVLALDLVGWRAELMQRTGNNSSLCDDVLSSYEEWSGRLDSVGVDFLRWASHGRTGLSLLWLAYAQCVAGLGGDSEAEKAIGVASDTRNTVIGWHWAQQPTLESSSAPIKVLEMLGLELS